MPYKMQKTDYFYLVYFFNYALLKVEGRGTYFFGNLTLKSCNSIMTCIRQTGIFLGMYVVWNEKAMLADHWNTNRMTKIISYFLQTVLKEYHCKNYFTNIALKFSYKSLCFPCSSHLLKEYLCKHSLTRVRLKFL